MSYRINYVGLGLVAFSLGLIAYPIEFVTNFLFFYDQPHNNNIQFAFLVRHLPITLGIIFGVMLFRKQPPNDREQQIVVVLVWSYTFVLALAIPFISEKFWPWDDIAIFGDDYWVRSAVRAGVSCCRAVPAAVFALSFMFHPRLQKMIWIRNESGDSEPKAGPSEGKSESNAALFLRTRVQ